jgi:Rod binding domain-containing protein
MTEHRNMRASDADRAHIAERLRRAADEGRLLADEFDDRLGQALNARTYGELDAIVADLPRERVPAERPGRVGALLRSRPRPVVKAAAAAGAVAATVVVLLAPPAATQSASQQAPVLVPAASRPALPSPPAPPRAPQPPSPPLRPPVASP